jgi:hypothetical protein
MFEKILVANRGAGAPGALPLLRLAIRREPVDV